MDFGAFILAPDDMLNMRDTEFATARDNVVLEIGLFAGDRDLERTFMVRPNDTPNLRIPSDLAGITAAIYSSARAATDPRNAMSPPSSVILENIRRIVSEEPKLDVNVFARYEPSASWKLKFYIQLTNNSDQSVLLRSVDMNLNLPLEHDYKRIQGRIVPGFKIAMRVGLDVSDSTILLRRGEETQIWLPLLPTTSVEDVAAMIKKHSLGTWRYEECWLDAARVRSRTLTF